MNKRILAMLLSLVMLLGPLVPVSVAIPAVEGDTETIQSAPDSIEEDGSGEFDDGITGSDFSVLSDDIDGDELDLPTIPEVSDLLNPQIIDDEPEGPHNPSEPSADSEAESQTEPSADPAVENPSEPKTIDAEKLKEDALKATNEAEFESYLNSLTEEELLALMEVLTEEDHQALRERFPTNDIEVEGFILPKLKSYTKVGKLLPPVMVAQRSRNAMNDSSDTPEGLELSKEVVPLGDEEYRITLEAYTTGKVESSKTSIPTDVVLVLDESGSMDFPFVVEEVYAAADPQINSGDTYYIKRSSSSSGYTAVKYFPGVLAGWYAFDTNNNKTGLAIIPKDNASDTHHWRTQFYRVTSTRRDALKSAATNFVNSVYNDATLNNVNHRISVVGFSARDYERTMVGLVSDIRDNRVVVKDAIQGLSATGGTYIERGMSLAKSAFDDALPPASTGLRKRVVIVFTDGIPGSGTWNATTIDGSANPAISTSNTLKGSGYGATVYSIALLEDAAPQAPIDYGNTDKARTNRFLHFLSSNFPNATGMDQGGAGDGGNINGGYYLSVDSPESLNYIFESIAKEIATPDIELSEATVIDYVSPYFDVPENVTDIKLYTAEYNGSTFNDRILADGVSSTIDGEKISVSGFDFYENYVTEEPRGTPSFYGKKLIIEFTVKPKSGFLGGNKVPTNLGQSGIYDNNGDSIAYFDVPTVDVPLKPIEITIPSDVLGSYYGQPIDEEDLKLEATVSIGSFTLDFEKPNYGLEPWQNAFVEIGVTSSTDATGGVSEVTADFNYTLTVTVTPTKEGNIGTTGATKTGTGTILVFKPKLTFKDSDVWYGGTATYGTNPNLSNKTWISGAIDHNDSGVTMLNGEPEMTLEYVPETGKIINGGIVDTKDDIAVNVNVSIPMGLAQEVEYINEHTTFVHECTDSQCQWDSLTPVPVHGNPAFLLHVKTVTLEIEKVLKEGTVADPNELFLVKVQKENASGVMEDYTELSIAANQTIAIEELPIGTYKVVEDTGWSWRYEVKYYPDEPNKGIVTLSPSTISDRVTLTNDKTTDQWLNDYSWETNIRGIPKTDN